MKALTFTSPSELEDKTKKMLDGYRKAVLVAKADLKKAGISFTSTKYALKINEATVSMIMIPGHLTKREYIQSILSASTDLRVKYETTLGVITVEHENS